MLVVQTKDFVFIVEHNLTGSLCSLQKSKQLPRENKGLLCFIGWDQLRMVSSCLIPFP
jgi:hypothetical protein